MRILLPIIIISLFLGVGATLVLLKPEAAEETKIDTSVVVKTIALEREKRLVTIDSQGVVESINTSQLAARTSGSVEKVHEDFLSGSILKKGTVLIQIDDTEYQVRVSQAEAEVLRTQAILSQERAQAEVAAREWASISDQNPTKLALREPQRLQAEAALKAANATLRGARKSLSDTRVVLPFDALIVSRNVSLGSYLGLGAPVATVKDVSVAEIVLPVISEDLQFVNGNPIGQQVTLTTNQNSRYLAKISRVEGMIDERSRMVNVVARIEDPYQLVAANENLPHLSFGTYVNAAIEAQSLTDTVQLPRSAVHDRLLGLDETGSTTDRLESQKLGAAGGAAASSASTDFLYEVYVARLREENLAGSYQDANQASLHIIPVELVYSSGGLSSVRGDFLDADQIITSNVDIAIEGMPLIISR